MSFNFYHLFLEPHYTSCFYHRCQLVDFYTPTNSDGGHPEMFNWVLQYFQRCDDFKPPLYLQHQGKDLQRNSKSEGKEEIRKGNYISLFVGHSRTIIGVEQLRDGSITMLVLDPSHSPAQMAQFNSTSSALGAMRLVRKSIAAMKARQYQVVAVTGIMETDLEYHVSFHIFIRLLLIFSLICYRCDYLL